MSVRYTQQQLEQRGFVLSTDGWKREPKTKTVRIPRINKNLEDMKFKLKLLNIPFKTEYKFDESRRFKADIAIVKHRILIEYEGLICNSNKNNSTGKSGHTTIKGYSDNCIKYNLATVLGWRLLRYTALNFQNMITDVERIVKG